MNTSSMTHQTTPRTRDDYRLIGGAGERATAAKLVNADWYKCSVPRQVMKGLMQRDDVHAIRDTALWYTLILSAGALFAYGWNAGWSAATLFAAYFVYATLYCGPADSRWHESSHGTAFKTRWINDVLYQCASFQVLRRPTRWRWSHARHHTDTLITGRDPEIAAPVPIDLVGTLLNVFAIKHGPKELLAVLYNAIGKISADEKTFVPEMEWPRMVREARLWVLAYATILGIGIALHSWLPVLFLGLLPGMLGAWFYNYTGLTQHAGLPENVLDHRLNSRTVYMNPLLRFMYWNMNYHIEHHMFPMVPYHQLPKLHDVIKADCPPPYRSSIEAYREILPSMWIQLSDPYYFATRTLSKSAV